MWNIIKGLILFITEIEHAHAVGVPVDYLVPVHADGSL
jgi:hypothetical protein